MLVDYHNIITTKRNLMLSLVLLFISIISEQKNINVLNLYFFTLELRPLNIPCQSNSDRRNPITPELKF
jgi:hypothetical protein